MSTTIEAKSTVPITFASADAEGTGAACGVPTRIATTAPAAAAPPPRTTAAASTTTTNPLLDFPEGASFASEPFSSSSDMARLRDEHTHINA
jgi:hypothetical protein